MNIYLINQLGDIDYDEFQGFVVVASRPAHARRLISERCADTISARHQEWDKDHASVELIGVAKKSIARIVIEDFKAG